MQTEVEHRVAAGATIRDGFVSLVRPPFRGLLLLALLISLTTIALPTEGDQGTLFAALVLTALSLYLQIAVTAAAADPDPSPSVDAWVREGFARRCFWRFFAASLLVVLALVGASIVGLVIGGFLVGAVLALTDPIVVLERRRPLDAIARSAELSRSARKDLMIVFGLLVLIPTLAVQVGSFVWDLPEVLGVWWPAVTALVQITGVAAAISLTRAFLALGGQRVPIEKRQRT
jgi:hypothetical protein